MLKTQFQDVMDMTSKANACVWKKPNRDADSTMVVDDETVMIDGMGIVIVMGFEEVEEVEEAGVHRHEVSIAFL